MTLNYDIGITVEGVCGAVKRVAEVAGSTPAAMLAIAPGVSARARSRGVARNPGAGPGEERRRQRTRGGTDVRRQASAKDVSGYSRERIDGSKLRVRNDKFMGDEELYFRK
jgi:hypothetical protein